MKCILKVKSRCQHNCLHSRDFRENPSLLFSESTYISCCMAPSSKDCITFCIQSQFLSSHLSDRPSFFLLIRTLRIKWAHPYNPGSSSFLKIFNLTAKSFYQSAQAAITKTPQTRQLETNRNSFSPSQKEARNPKSRCQHVEFC